MLFKSPPGIKSLHYPFVDLVLRSYYAVFPRVYHNAHHIYDLFQTAIDHGWALTPAEELALLFHDAIYVPGYSGNEAASVNLLHSFVGHYAGRGELFTGAIAREHMEQIVSEAGSMIISTRDHERGNPNNGADASRVIDLDLYGIALPEKFQKSTDQVWKEYRGTLLAMNQGDEIKALHRFNAGRIDWIAQFLKRKRIYQTKLFQEKYEDVARDNLRAEGKRLLNLNMPMLEE